MGLLFKLTITNKTSSPNTYLNGNVSLPASGSVQVDEGQIPFLAFDTNFLTDVVSSNITVTDGVNERSGDDILRYIKEYWIIGRTAAKSSDPVSYTLAGQGYSVAGVINLPNTNENNAVLIKNPVGSGVLGRLMKWYLATDGTQGTAIARFYVQPTITGNGNSLTIQNNRGGSQPATAMQAFTSPTTSAKGTLRLPMICAANSTPPIHDFQQTLITTPGDNILLTLQAGNLGLLASINVLLFLQWAET